MSIVNQEATLCCPSDNMKLKILAIHGYRQNAETFKAKTGSFRKMIHKWAQITYITAPHRVIVVEDSNDIGQKAPDNGESKDEGKKYLRNNLYLNFTHFKFRTIWMVF